MNIISVIQIIVALLGLFGSFYIFHRKVIMADINATVFTRVEAKEMATRFDSSIEERYSKPLGDRLERDVETLKVDVKHEISEIRKDLNAGLTEIRTDIKTLLLRD